MSSQTDLRANLSNLLRMRAHAVGTDERMLEFQAYKRAACDFITVYGGSLERAILTRTEADEAAGLERIDGLEFYLRENVEDGDAEPVRLVMAMSHNNKVFCHRATQADNGVCADEAATVDENEQATQAAQLARGPNAGRAGDGITIYYVVEVRGGDFDNIPISMFGVPALFTSDEAAWKFCEFSKGTGRPHEVRQWFIPFESPKDEAATVGDGLYAWVRESPRHWERVTESDLSQPADPQKMRADGWFPVYTRPQDASAGREVMNDHGRKALHRCIRELEKFIELAGDYDLDEMSVQALQTANESMQMRLDAALPSPPKGEKS